MNNKTLQERVAEANMLKSTIHPEDKRLINELFAALKEAESREITDAFEDDCIENSRIVELESALKAEQAKNKRYEYVRTLNAHQFTELYRLNITSGKPFDTLVDEALNAN